MICLEIYHLNEIIFNVFFQRLRSPSLSNTSPDDLGLLAQNLRLIRE